ncbi:MAG: hypothetical protein V4713_13115, partial [Pseudomonadota bacterium]
MMMKKRASAALLGATLCVMGGAMAADTDGKKMATDKDGMISVQQVMEMERARLHDKMKAMGIQGDKMTPTEWDKLREDLYRGI